MGKLPLMLTITPLRPEDTPARDVDRTFRFEATPKKGRTLILPPDHATPVRCYAEISREFFPGRAGLQNLTNRVRSAITVHSPEKYGCFSSPLAKEEMK